MVTLLVSYVIYGAEKTVSYYLLKYLGTSSLEFFFTIVDALRKTYWFL